MTSTDAFSLDTQPKSDTGTGPIISCDTLDNGLQVVVIPDRRAPVVTHMVWYRNGSADDPTGKSGIAHFLEHLMFKGTKRHPDGRFSKIVSELGGQENAFTSYDFTCYFQRVAREHLPVMMDLEADRMTGLVLSDEVVDPERDVVLEERRMRVEGDPGHQLVEALMASLYVHHPYGTPIIGWMHEIEGLGREDALAYYRRFYTPTNATLVVAGDVSHDEVMHLARTTYGNVQPTGANARRERVSEPEPKAARRVEVSDSKVDQPLLQRYYLAPSDRLAGLAKTAALDVLARCLGGGSTSRLYRDLCMNDGPAASVGAHYSSFAVDQSRFGIYAVPRGDITLADLESKLDIALADVLANGFRPDELARARTRLVAQMIYAQDSQYSLAYYYGSALASGIGLDDARQRIARIEAVTAEDVLQAAREVLVPRRSVTGWLTRAAAA